MNRDFKNIGRDTGLCLSSKSEIELFVELLLNPAV